ncbi:MAG: hypothetical protein EOO02_23795, partial [Chitinophagaceae bacterium]
MCTVTFVPAGDKIMLTSSRDERTTRATALPPAVKEWRGKKIMYPTDPQSGGSWIGVNEHGHAAVLLNGAFNNHIPQTNYRLSRGRIFMDIISNKQPSEQFQKLSLFDIEPFTLIIVMTDEVWDFRWDGLQKHSSPLEKDLPHIWSSATLYDPTHKAERETWFSDFLSKNPTPSEQDILHFHLAGGNGDPGHNLVMQRGDVYATASITRLSIMDDSANMY